MIYFIAPYSKKFLGASRKIELLLGILSKIDSDVVLVNSWVDTDNTASFIELWVDDKLVRVPQYFLPAKSKNRLIYSCINFIELDSIVNKVINDLGKPDRIWLYNCYFLETHLALKLQREYKAQLILELEDSCFSRARGWNPKPYLDNFAWNKLISRIDHAFAVNLTLANEINSYGKKVDLLPGLIAPELVNHTNKPENKPFSRRNKRIKLGYFGGLSAEKGAQMLIDLFRVLPDTFEFVITGTGELEKAIQLVADEYPERFRYYGRVSNEALIDFIAEVDVFLNPHQPMEEMGNGVFPFKVMEAIASKRIILSTSLAGNQDFQETLDGIVFLPYDLEIWKSTLQDIGNIYRSTEHKIIKASNNAIDLFSEQAVIEKIKEI